MHKARMPLLVRMESVHFRLCSGRLHAAGSTQNVSYFIIHNSFIFFKLLTKSVSIRQRLPLVLTSSRGIDKFLLMDVDLIVESCPLELIQYFQQTPSNNTLPKKSIQRRFPLCSDSKQQAALRRLDDGGTTSGDNPTVHAKKCLVDEKPLVDEKVIVF